MHTIIIISPPFLLPNCQLTAHHLVRVRGGEGGEEGARGGVLADSNVDVGATKHWWVVVHVGEADFHPGCVCVTGVPPTASALKKTRERSQRQAG